MNTKRILTGILVILFAITAAIAGASVSAAEEKAENIAKSCKYTFSSNASKKSKLLDNDLSTLYSSEKSGEQYIEIDFDGKQAQGIYIKWRKPCYDWKLCVDRGEGFGEPEQRGQYAYVQEYVELDESVTKVKILTDDASAHPLEILDLFVYDIDGELPASVHKWNPTPSKAELMAVSTHQDDEILFFGGTIAYYGNELGLDTVVVYMAFENGLRLHESLEGLWVCGYKQNPVFLCYPDKYCTSLKKAEQYWKRSAATYDITELILRHEPQVIVTHDEEGEYGHGQHILTVECIKDGIRNAADQAYIDSNFPSEEVYNVPKCYLHLYSKNKVVLPWDELSISSAGGKSSLAVAQEAFKKHASQWSTGFRVRMSGSNNCSKFGLYHTTVGNDVLCNDFFENIELRISDIKLSEEELPDEFSRVPNFEHLYIYTDPVTDEQQYARYGTVSGSDGWYFADETGAIITPAAQLSLFEDASCTDISTYETVTASDISPLIYVYKAEETAEEQYVRYGSYNGGFGWFAVDEAGKPSDGTAAELKKEFPVFSPADTEIPVKDKDDSGKPLRSTSVSVCVLVLIAVVTVVVMLKKRSREPVRNGDTEI